MRRNHVTRMEMEVYNGEMEVEWKWNGNGMEMDGPKQPSYCYIFVTTALAWCGLVLCSLF